MIGKKNIVFGFLYLVLTAALGPVMIIQHYPDVEVAELDKQKKVGALQEAVSSGFEQDLEPMTPEQIAKTNSHAILAMSARSNAQVAIDSIKGGPHAHGNLEALLNIAVGLLLCFLAIHPMFKQAISWIFIIGTVMHSGLLYLVVALQQEWATALLGGPVAYIGPVLILTGLTLAGIATLLGFRGSIETDF
jgi:uncharacterized membrane protein YgdD (TMEM256/DUF423 family)